MSADNKSRAAWGALLIAATTSLADLLLTVIKNWPGLSG